MTDTPTLESATGFVLSHATEDDLNRLAASIKQRRTSLATIRAATLTTGTTVRIANIKPRYLAGLTGRIASIDGGHATISLDAASTDRVRMHGARRRYYVPDDATSFELPGVPLSCCMPTT